jgi:protein-S-isoprenylcysteine O-methyltransferase Ste14
MSFSRIASGVFTLAAYLLFLAVSAYSVAFLSGHGVARTIDRGGPHSGTGAALAIDALLLGLFAVQHSVMARPLFKRAWTRLVPQHAERSAYVAASSAVLALLFWQWRPLPHTVWDVASDPGRAVLWAVFGLGWAIVVAMTFAIDHLDLTGLRQAGDFMRSRPPARPEFRLPMPYRIVRHPMMTGFALAFVATPHMSAGHLLFAGLGCAYIVVGVRLEERDLGAALPEYAEYAARTPRFVPVPARRSAATCPVPLRSSG